jgi:hypothetical protein
MSWLQVRPGKVNELITSATFTTAVHMLFFALELGPDMRACAVTEPLCFVLSLAAGAPRQGGRLVGVRQQLLIPIGICGPYCTILAPDLCTWLQVRPGKVNLTFWCMTTAIYIFKFAPKFALPLHSCCWLQVRPGKVNELMVYDNFSRVGVEEVQAGDICAVTGIQDIGVSYARYLLLIQTSPRVLSRYYQGFVPGFACRVVLVAACACGSCGCIWCAGGAGLSAQCRASRTLG